MATIAQGRERSPEQREQVAGEMADVLLYLVQLVQLGKGLGIDPVAAAQARLGRNAQRYPVDKARGSS